MPESLGGAVDTSSARFHIAERVGKPVAAWVTLALTEDGEVFAVYPTGDDPRVTAELTRRGQHLLGCSEGCPGCDSRV